MTFWAYLLRCGDGSYYAGHCEDLGYRIDAHQSGRGCDYTARRQPITPLWSQEFESRIEALEAERRIKGWSRAKKEALIAGDWICLSQLAASRVARPSTSSGRTEKGGGVGIEDENIKCEDIEGHDIKPTVCAEPVEAPRPTLAQPPGPIP
ncbi:GIY-YIG nuclease family protein [Sphingomonas aliaeris]|uniref:GIY-YIG nuclease family protein n=1 Tax=Sphingomonas aliaeris TaxID=2759526 RepID=A0A974S5P6_9SPHN|nr:GIY-YIG nuclease family protein [Sphingomonas aliaeris]QQV78626.1 GIY-YIG nuclease family protein [Sphingomonas aliaeris]